MLFRLYILSILNIIVHSFPMKWNRHSWRNVPKPSPLIPEYYEKDVYEQVYHRLENFAPLIFAQEARTLKEQLASASVGKSFVLIGGDCAERFQDSNVNKIWTDFNLFLQLSLLLTYGLGKPIVKIGRIGGQYAKPRSSPLEHRDGITLPAYQGDIINSPVFSKNERIPNPLRMLEAYHLSTQTLNILRAFIQGGYTDIYNHSQWGDGDFKKALRFMKALQLSSDTIKELRDISFFIGHECLLLPYEECLVRKDSLTNDMYDCSSHFLWIGERTRELEGPHVEFVRGISNPIGVKISDKMTPNELLELTFLLNPENEMGRLSLITRMGQSKLKEHLPSFIDILQQHDRNVVWICDPMHGNTQTISNTKTRDFKDIFNEILSFFEIHWSMNSIPAGIHLEMTGKNVTECIGGCTDPVLEFSNYESGMDPRLNSQQSIDLISLIIKLHDISTHTRHLFFKNKLI